MNLQTFLGRQSSGCMQVNPTELIYHFQMSAVAIVNGIRIEGMLSSVNEQSIVYVPNPGKSKHVYTHLTKSVVVPWGSHNECLF